MSARKYPSDLSNMRFGKWLVLRDAKETHCLCRCDCGNERKVSRYSLLRGVSVSCGRCRLDISAGDRFGHLVAIRFDHREPNTGVYWLCRCDCGRETVIRGSDLMRRKVNCGCKQYAGMRVDDIGVRYGRLVVVAYNGMYRDCVCDCGKTVTVARWSLASGATQSCGCLRAEIISRIGATIGIANLRGQNRYDWHVKVAGKRIAMRSSFEVIFAKYLLKHRIRFEYEPRKIQLSPDTIYIPDFYLPDSDTWVEVKGHRPGQWARKRELFERAGYRLVVVTSASLDTYLSGISYKTWMKRNAHKYLRKP